MEKVKSVLPIKEIEEEAYFSLEENKTLFESFSSLSLLDHNASDDGPQTLLLALNDSTTPALRGESRIAVVNSSTKHPELAMAYLENYMKEYNSFQKTFILQGHLKSVKNEEFERQKSDLENNLRFYQEELKSTEPIYQEEIEHRIQELRLYLENNDNFRWIISPEGVRQYENAIPYVYIIPEEGYDEKGKIEEIYRLFYQFIDEEITLEAFIKETNEWLKP